MNESDLLKLGYKRNPDGSYARPERVSHPKPKQAAGPALDSTAQGEGESKGRFAVCITRRATRLLDVDNFAGGCKPIIDQLRYAKLIPDDDPASVAVTFQQEKVRSKKDEGTTIQISKQTNQIIQ